MLDMCDPNEPADPGIFPEWFSCSLAQFVPVPVMEGWGDTFPGQTKLQPRLLNGLWTDQASNPAQMVEGTQTHVWDLAS